MYFFNSLTNFKIIIFFSERSKGREIIEDEQLNFDVSEEDLKEDKDGGGDQSEEKKTFKEKLQAVQDVTAMVQNALGIVAHLAEGMIFYGSRFYRLGNPLSKMHCFF